MEVGADETGLERCDGASSGWYMRFCTGALPPMALYHAVRSLASSGHVSKSMPRRFIALAMLRPYVISGAP